MQEKLDLLLVFLGQLAEEQVSLKHRLLNFWFVQEFDPSNFC